MQCFKPDSDLLRMGSLFKCNERYLGQDEQRFAVIARYLRLKIMNHRFSSFLNETTIQTISKPYEDQLPTFSRNKSVTL